MKIRLPSFSSLDTFSRCPRQYAHDVIEGRPPPNKAMLRGTHLHNSLEAAARICLREGLPWEEALSAVRADPPEGVLPREELESYLERAVPVLQDLVPVPGGVEAWFDDVGPAFDLPSLPVRGKIDLMSPFTLQTSEQARRFGVAQRPSVIDYKTISGEHRIKNSHEARRSMQLKIYCLAAGINHAGFIYFPPKTEVRATFVEFSTEDLQLAHRWLTLQLQAVLSCWARFLGLAASWGHEYEVPEDPDWGAFPLSHPDNFLCSPKWCERWGECLGAS